MQDSDEIRVAAEGSVNLAPVGTTLPTNLGNLNAAFFDVGYLDENGVTITDGVTVQDIMAWQAPDPIRKNVTARTKTVAGALQQWNVDNYKVAHGGGEWTQPSPGVYRYDPPADEDGLTEYACVLDWQDGDYDHRIVIPRVVMQEGVTTQLVRTSSAKLPITLAALRPDTGGRWYHLTSDPAFDEAS